MLLRNDVVEVPSPKLIVAPSIANSNCDTLVAGSVKEAPMIKAIEEPPQESRPESKVVETTDQKEENSNNKGDIISLPVYESKFGRLPSWFKNLFGRSDKFTQDLESQTLEAYIIHDGTKAILKLPFGHQRLDNGLKRTLKSNRNLSWDQYVALDPQHHQDLNRTIINAKHQDSRERTCIAVDLRKKQSSQDADRLVVFFSLGAPVEPIHLNICVGRKFDIPFEHCRTWDVSSDLRRDKK
jgi:hypothetical protein